MLDHIRIGEGKEILFLHGWGCTKEIFNLSYSPSFCLTAPDLYGFGSTPAPPFGVDLDYYVRGVRQLLEHYHMEDVTIVAHSFGARIALRLAQDSRISGLVLIGAAGLRPRRKPIYYLRVLHAKLARLFALSGPKGSKDYSTLSPVMKRTFINIVHTYQDRELQLVRCPVLLIWGEEDRETPLYMLRKFEHGLPHSNTVMLEGCGHFCFLEQSSRVHQLIKEFVRNL
ncbi:MAG: alpha/beta hydrolase [Clostridia bacterium]|nr:alpha/beta hydrolase [Clostridia bacterium]